MFQENSLTAQCFGLTMGLLQWFLLTINVHQTTYLCIALHIYEVWFTVSFLNCLIAVFKGRSVGADDLKKQHWKT